MQMAHDYEFLCIIDFEATAGDTPQPIEIIEFPAVLLRKPPHEKGWRKVDEFQRYVRPEAYPRLTAFITELTGITQEQVDCADVLSKVLKEFEMWRAAHGLTKDNCLPVTCGDFDCRFLQACCGRSGLPCPSWARTFCNIKFIYQQIKGGKKPGMAGMLAGLGLTLDGRHHSGIDDSRNIAKIAMFLAHQHGAVIQPTTRDGDRVAQLVPPAVAAGGGAPPAPPSPPPAPARKESSDEIVSGVEEALAAALDRESPARVRILLHQGAEVRSVSATTLRASCPSLISTSNRSLQALLPASRFVTQFTADNPPQLWIAFTPST